jgi:hypothetical protein
MEKVVCRKRITIFLHEEIRRKAKQNADFNEKHKPSKSATLQEKFEDDNCLFS